MGRVDQSAGFNREHVIGRTLGQFSLVCSEYSTCDVNKTCECSLAHLGVDFYWRLADFNQHINLQRGQSSNE